MLVYTSDVIEYPARCSISSVSYIDINERRSRIRK